VSEVNPVAGQWYENLGTRYHCIAVSESAGECVMQWKNGDFEIVEESDYEDLKHLPDCTGWDWEPETFPQYYVSRNPEWVDLPMDHRIRAEIDWYDYGGFFDYVCKGSTLIGVRVGDTQAKKARCRRKDLPKPAKKRTITVPKWLCRSWGNWQVLECSKPIGFEEVHRVGETTYTEQEDGTWIES